MSQSNTVSLEPASQYYPGLITTGPQTFSGAMTFSTPAVSTLDYLQNMPTDDVLTSLYDEYRDTFNGASVSVHVRRPTEGDIGMSSYHCREITLLAGTVHGIIIHATGAFLICSEHKSGVWSIYRGIKHFSEMETKCDTTWVCLDDDKPIDNIKSIRADLDHIPERIWSAVAMRTMKNLTMYEYVDDRVSITNAPGQVLSIPMTSFRKLCPDWTFVDKTVQLNRKITSPRLFQLLCDLFIIPSTNTNLGYILSTGRYAAFELSEFFAACSQLGMKMTHKK